MEYGIQRRSVCLIPPDEDGFEWIFEALDRPDIYENLGLIAPAGAEVRRRHAEGDHVFALICRADGLRRVGFAVVFPPTEAFDAWSFAYAIPDPRDRDGYTALHATDAMAHYLFEHLRVPVVGFDIRADRNASDAIIRRIGYTAYTSREVLGQTFRLYRVDRATWDRRKAKLERGERDHPSGVGAVFVKLRAPWAPVVPHGPPPSPT